MDELSERTPQTPEEEPEKKKKTVDPNTRRAIRILIGGYLVYLAYQLFDSIMKGTATGTSLVICAIAAGVFVIAGVYFVVSSLLALLRGK